MIMQGIARFVGSRSRELTGLYASRSCVRRVMSSCLQAVVALGALAAPQWARADFEISSGIAKRHFGAAIAFAETGSIKLMAIGGPGAVGGRVHVFRSVDGGNWESEAVLGANIITTNPFFQFGAALAMRVDTDGTALLVVGAPFVEQGRGQVFLFRRPVDSPWNLQQVIRHPDAQPNDTFGSSVAISPDLSRIAIGAVADNFGTVGSSGLSDGRGSVLVLRREQDDYIVSSFASDAIPGNLSEKIGSGVAFGSAAGKTPELLVGAPRGRNAGGLVTGKVYVLREKPNRSWQVVKSITPNAPGVQLGDFGASVAATSTRAVVGAPRSNVTPTGGSAINGAGAAFTLKKVNGVWSVDARLARTETGVATGNFGRSVSIDGTAVAVGTQEERAYLYRRDNTGAWRLLDELRHASGSEPKPNEKFGFTVALGVGQMAVSSMLRDLGAVPQNGSVSLFDVVPTKFFSTQPTSEGFFGTASAMFGSRAAIGSSRDTVGPLIPGASEDGLVRIMDRSNGVWVPEFTANAFDRDIGYGAAIAMPRATTVVIGAPRIGAYDTLERVAPGQWTLTQRVREILLPGAASNGLGSSLAAVVDDDRLLVAAGAPSTPEPGGVFASGRVEFSTPGSFGAVPATIPNPSPALGDLFGSSLAMQRYSDGTIDLWVGAGGANTAAGFDSGALYLFRRGPTEVNFRLIQADITLPGTESGERLGERPESLAIKGRTLVVGSRLRNAVPGQFDTGIVHVLRRSPTGVWSAIADTLRVPSSEGLSELGFSVATNGGRIIVGVPGENRAIIARIAGEQIIEESVSVQPDPDFEGSRYGATVAMGPGTQPAIVVGAPDDRIGDLGFAGSAYGFSGSWDPCAADLDSSGTVDLVDLSLLLASWGASGVIDGEPSADLDADGVVKSSDMQRLLQAWGGCGG